MIGVRKIVYACYEMPDPQQQAEYYTDILGLTLIERDKDAVYLASTIDHHSVVLRKGGEAKCVRLGFQIGPNDDLAAFDDITRRADIPVDQAAAFDESQRAQIRSERLERRLAIVKIVVGTKGQLGHQQRRAIRISCPKGRDVLEVVGLKKADIHH